MATAKKSTGVVSSKLKSPTAVELQKMLEEAIEAEKLSAERAEARRAGEVLKKREELVLAVRNSGRVIEAARVEAVKAQKALDDFNRDNPMDLVITKEELELEGTSSRRTYSREELEGMRADMEASEEEAQSRDSVVSRPNGSRDLAASFISGLEVEESHPRGQGGLASFLSGLNPFS